MPQPLSYHRLLAEVQTWPLCSSDAFTLRPYCIGRSGTGSLDGETQALAAGLEVYLRTRAGGLSLDGLAQIRDHTWFAQDAPQRSQEAMAAYLVRLARMHLGRHGSAVALRAGEDPPERAARWRWLSLFVPQDLLIAALFADPGDGDPLDDRVSLTMMSPHLGQVLDRPCAETHLHVGAAIPFSLMWCGLMRQLADILPEPKKLAVPPGHPFRDGPHFLGVLFGAAFARTLLASFLWRRERTGGPTTWRDFRREWEGEIWQAVVGPGGSRSRACGWEAQRALGLLFGQARRPSLPRLRPLYRSLIGRAPGGEVTSQLDVLRRDPLAAWLPPALGRASPEVRFTCRALRYLRSGVQDREFSELFFQYLRVRCLTFRLLGEEPGTAGLDWFSQHFTRISPLRGAVDRVKYQLALESETQDLRLRALEVRTSPGTGWHKVRDELRALARQAAGFVPRPGYERPEVGLVLHFVKESHSKSQGRWSRTAHASPESRAFGARYGIWFHERWQEAQAICTVLRRRPEWLVLLRGIDVANLELAVPTWPLVPLFNRTRAASIAAAEELARRRSWRAPALRATFHAGEDFRRLSEGLRRIHEPIEFGLLGPGDRIGHGLALGLDPERWAAAGGLLCQPLEERLDDLLWEMERYGRGDFAPGPARLEVVRTEVVRLGREIYRDHADRGDLLDNLLEARRLRHAEGELRRLGYPFLRHTRSDVARSLSPSRRLLHAYLTDGGIFQRGQRPVEVPVKGGEVAMLREAQDWLRGELGRLEITVESNPSSNLLIADLLALEEHPAFRLHPLASQPAQRGVLLSISTDNPLTFSTCLADECAYVYLALLRKGVSAPEALLWLDQVREQGWRSRFTVPASTERELLRALGHSSVH